MIHKYYYRLYLCNYSNINYVNYIRNWLILYCFWRYAVRLYTAALVKLFTWCTGMYMYICMYIAAVYVCV